MIEEEYVTIHNARQKTRELFMAFAPQFLTQRPQRLYPPRGGSLEGLTPPVPMNDPTTVRIRRQEAAQRINPADLAIPLPPSVAS